MYTSYFDNEYNTRTHFDKKKKIFRRLNVSGKETFDITLHNLKNNSHVLSIKTNIEIINHLNFLYIGSI